MDNEKEAVKTIIDIINTTTSEFKNIPSIDKMIANRYHQKIEDVRLWLSLTEWGQENVSLNQVEKVQDTLQHLDLIESKIPSSEILYFF